MTLVDKVYTVMAPNDTLRFEHQLLVAEYQYEILVKIVTPHQCELNLTITDPLTRAFEVLSGILQQEPSTQSYYSIPFGISTSGNYTFKFASRSTLNYNLYIRITQETKCLFDKLSPFDFGNLKFYRVLTFDDAIHLEHVIELETDVSYDFFLGRVSAIAADRNNSVVVDYSLTDPYGVPFMIAQNRSLPGIAELEHVSFGTALNGIYVFKVTIYCAVEWVNIAYAVIKDYSISGVVNPNGSQGGDNNSSSLDPVFYLSPDLTLGLILASGIGGAIAIIAGFIRIKGKRI
jgi:hypothetical protein